MGGKGGVSAVCGLQGTAEPILSGGTQHKHTLGLNDYLIFE